MQEAPERPAAWLAAALMQRRAGNIPSCQRERLLPRSEVPHASALAASRAAALRVLQDHHPGAAPWARNMTVLGKTE